MSIAWVDLFADNQAKDTTLAHHRLAGGGESHAQTIAGRGRFILEASGKASQQANSQAADSRSGQSVLDRHFIRGERVEKRGFVINYKKG